MGTPVLQLKKRDDIAAESEGRMGEIGPGEQHAGWADSGVSAQTGNLRADRAARGPVVRGAHEHVTSESTASRFRRRGKTRFFAGLAFAGQSAEVETDSIPLRVFEWE